MCRASTFAVQILLLRMAKKDFTVTSKGKSFTVPKGHFVGTSPYVAMRLPTVFKNPDEVRKRLTQEHQQVLHETVRSNVCDNLSAFHVVAASAACVVARWLRCDDFLSASSCLICFY